MVRVQASLLMMPVALLLPFLVLAAGEMSPAEFADMVARDKVQWANVKTVESRYQAPPANWQHVTDTTANLDIAIPCNWERSVIPMDSTRFIFLYSCKAGARAYSVMVEPLEDGNAPEEQNEYYVGAQYGYRMVSEKRGDKVVFTPVARVVYSGLVGRQEAVTRGKQGGAARTLFMPHAAIVLRVMDDPGNLPGDLEQFFNAQHVN